MIRLLVVRKHFPLEGEKEYLNNLADIVKVKPFAVSAKKTKATYEEAPRSILL